MNDIRVYVVKYPDRKNLVMRYLDPLTGKHVQRSARTSKQKEAERKAAKWESELQDGRYHKPSRTTWEEFREKYELEIVTGLGDTTALKISGVLNAVESYVNPQYVRDMTAASVDKLKAGLRNAGKAETTIQSHMAHLKAALHAAVRWGMIPNVPDVGRVARAKRSKLMKGRPITTEEFERMLDRTSAVVGDNAAPSWKHYLTGLWWSGLRLSESLELSRDDPTKPRVDLTGRRPVFLIGSEHEKGNKDRILPMAPEFAEFLEAMPDDARTGFVFNPKAKRRHGSRLSMDRVSRLMADIGERAGVIVDHNPTKFASAHDLRRSFGQRWAYRRNMNPQTLMVLMRHETISTTMKYYAGQDAEKVADILWSAVDEELGTILGTIDVEK